MGVEIAITVAREETRVAVLDGGVVTDLFGDRAKHKDFVGNIYKGKVAKVLPGMQAAFVDIGLAKAAFMHVSDLSLDSEPGDTLVDADEDEKDADKDGDMLGPRRQSSKPIEQLLSEGQELMVQISKGPIGTKGSRVTTYVSLPGPVSRVHAQRGTYRCVSPHRPRRGAGSTQGHYEAGTAARLRIHCPHSERRGERR